MPAQSTGPRKTLHKRVLKWGNSYGIRLTKSEVEAMGLHPDDEVDVGIEPVPTKIDWDAVPFLRIGDADLDGLHPSTDHDEILYRGWLREQEQKEQEERKSRDAVDDAEGA